MVAFSNWPSSVQKASKSDAISARFVHVSRFQPYLKTAWSTSLTAAIWPWVACYTIFGGKNMRLAFKPFPKEIDANPFGIPFSMVLKEVEIQQPLAVIQPAQGTFRPDAFHQAIKIFRINGLIFCGHRVRKFHQRPVEKIVFPVCVWVCVCGWTICIDVKLPITAGGHRGPQGVGGQQRHPLGTCVNVPVSLYSPAPGRL